MSDLTIKVLQDIREELRALRTDMNDGLGSLRSDMNDGFASVNGRLDSVLKIVGGHHTRLTRIEDHLGLPHEP